MVSDIDAGRRGVAELPVGGALRPAAPSVFRRLRSAIARREERGLSFCGGGGWEEFGMVAFLVAVLSFCRVRPLRGSLLMWVFVWNSSRR